MEYMTANFMFSPSSKLTFYMAKPQPWADTTDYT